jgi:hypothetical protein
MLGTQRKEDADPMVDAPSFESQRTAGGLRRRSVPDYGNLHSIGQMSRSQADCWVAKPAGTLML